MRVEHIGIAVPELQEALALYERLLGVKSYKTEEVLTEKVITGFFQAGDTKIELLEGTSPDSAISKFISQRGGGLHHVAFEVQDIRAEMQRLREEGFQLLSEEPKVGADNKLVCFVHPRSASGVLIELCQERPA